MSQLIARASDLLHERWKASHRKSVEAAETYSKLVLDSDGDPSLAETLVDAMDELGIGSKELNEDFVHLKLARTVVPRVQANREVQRRAHQGIRTAELALHEAQGTRCPQPIERAHLELAEAAGHAIDAQREGEALLQELRERAHRAPRVIRGHPELVERAMADADERRAQRAAGGEGSAMAAVATPDAAVAETTAGAAPRAHTVDASHVIAAAGSKAVRQMMGEAGDGTDPALG